MFVLLTYTDINTLFSNTNIDFKLAISQKNGLNPITYRQITV